MARKLKKEIPEIFDIEAERYCDSLGMERGHPAREQVKEAWVKGAWFCQSDSWNQYVDSPLFDPNKTRIERIKDNYVEVSSRLKYIDDPVMQKIADFILDYAECDYKEIYSNGSLEVPVFRVLDALIQKGKPYQECGG